MAQIKTHYLEVENLAELEVQLPLLLHQIKQEQDNEKLFDAYAKAYEAQLKNNAMTKGSIPMIIYENGKYYVIDGGKKYPYNQYPWHLVPDQKMFLYNDFLFLYDKSIRDFKPYIKTLPEVIVTAKGINSQLEDVRYKLAGTEYVYNQIQLYSSLLTSSLMSSALSMNSDMSMADSGLGTMMVANDLLDTINTDLKKFGFENLSEYEQTQNDFLRFIKIKAHRFVDKHFSKYAVSLKEEETYLSDKEYTKQLYKKLAASNANQYHKGSQQRLSAAQMFNKTGSIRGEKQRINTYRQGEKKQAIARKDIDSLGLFLTQSPDFDYDALSRVTSEQEMIDTLKSEIKKQHHNIKVSREYLFEDDTIFEFSEIIAQVLQQENIREGSVLFTIVMDKIKSEAFNKVLHGLAIAVFAIAVGLLTAGTGTIAILGAATVAVAGAYVTYEEIKDYRGKLATYNVNLSDNEPSIVWVIISIVGTVLDVAAFTKIASSLINAGRVFDKTGDIVTLEKSLAKLEGVTEAMRKNILKQASLDKQYKEVINFLKPKGVYMKLTLGLDQLVARVGVFAYHAIRRGILNFDNFLLELKASKIIDDGAKLSPNELKAIKDTFAKVKSDIKTNPKLTKKTTRNLQQEIKIEEDALTYSINVKETRKYKKSGDYHAYTTHKITDDVIQDIISNPEAIFLSKNKDFYKYYKDGTIAVVHAGGANGKNVLTAYGKAGVKGDSGVKLFGGSINDSAPPVTINMILNGKIPRKLEDNGTLIFFSPATQLWP